MAVTASRTSTVRTAASAVSSPPHHPLGAGCNQGTSNRGTSGAPTSSPGSCRSRGRVRRAALRSRSRQTLRAIREGPGLLRSNGRVELFAGPPGALQDVLNRVLGVERRTQHLVAERPQLAAKFGRHRRHRRHRQHSRRIHAPSIEPPGPGARRADHRQSTNVSTSSRLSADRSRIASTAHVVVTVMGHLPVVAVRSLVDRRFGCSSRCGKLQGRGAGRIVTRTWRRGGVFEVVRGPIAQTVRALP